jgi:RNA polymerase sigma-70 factor (ECF subfamily)
VSAYRAAHTFRGQSAVTTWLHRITVNACLDRARKAASRKTSPVDDTERLEQLLEPHESASAPAERNDLHRQLLEALGTLPPDQRAALILVDMQGYPVAEAARVLDVPIGTVKSRCARSRARLLPLLTHLRPADSGKVRETGRGRNRAEGTSVPPAAGPRDGGPDGAGTGDSAAVKGGGGRT